jgi:hypothetical protein
MTRSRGLLPLVRKEVRALAPLWAAGAATMIVLVPIDRPDMRGVPVLAYAVTAVALGALSFGHEFTHRTLPLLLAQPVSRAAVHCVKTAVLVVLLGLLCLAAVVVIPARDQSARLLLAPVLVGACLVPALTLLTRSALSGFVFGVVMPAVLLLSAEAATVMRFGWTSMPMPPEARALRAAVALWLFIGACAAALPATWLRFRHAQALEGFGRPLFAPVRGRAQARSARRSAVVELASKELRLQQGTLAVAALYPIGFVLILLLVRDPDPAWPVQLVIGLGWVHAVVVALMAGALASAEERQFGTLQMQLLLPISVARQWAITCGVAFGLALALAIGLPWLLSFAIPPPIGRDMFLRALGIDRVMLVCALVTGAVYVSSLMTGGVRALAASLPGIGAAGLIGSGAIVAVGLPLGAAIASALSALLGDDGLGASFDRLRFALLQGLALGLSAGVLMLVLWFALANHRFADRSWRRVGGQLLGLLVVVTLVAAIVAGVSRTTSRALTAPAAVSIHR